MQFPLSIFLAVISLWYDSAPWLGRDALVCRPAIVQGNVSPKALWGL